jgi:hypothetical protein
VYTIFHTLNLSSRKVEANVPSIDEAELYLATLGDVILFERDPDGHDAADACVFFGGDLHIFAIEAL